MAPPMTKHLTKTKRAIHFMVLAFLMTFGGVANADEQFNLDEWVFLSCQERDILSDKLGDWTKNKNFLVRKDHTQIYGYFLDHNNCKLVDRNKRLNCENSENNRTIDINRFTGHAHYSFDDNSDDVRFYTCRAIEAPMF